ncbi:Conserved_hypothetical protein [Hexamita inflata]|uniref:Secondary thiamine-phosphate synthase enzyme n=1 Tax=Hexamita inflata TaxID=28002 RepID=A0AA86Q5X8_9EUKA|nr:Conserved hypothetical protein [Hexamita inflata]CAI9971343.1 Conserved hypothetical protein [Hexamita inflata]
MTYFCDQSTLVLKGRQRGCYLITSEIEKKCYEALAKIRLGTCHLFLTHTSASLSINENADPDVRTDMSKIMTGLVPPKDDFAHNYEGSDDMPAHGLCSLMGVSVTIPIKDCRLQMGTWQGVYLNEHRHFGGDRKIIITIQGIEKTM